MIGRILAGIGGIITLIASVTSIATKEPLIYHLAKVLFITGDVVLGLGIIGVRVGSLLPHISRYF